MGIRKQRLMATKTLKATRERAMLSQEQAAEAMTTLLGKSVSLSLYKKIEQRKKGVLIIDTIKIINFWKSSGFWNEAEGELFEKGFTIKREGKEI